MTLSIQMGSGCSSLNNQAEATGDALLSAKTDFDNGKLIRIEDLQAIGLGTNNDMLGMHGSDYLYAPTTGAKTLKHVGFTFF